LKNDLKAQQAEEGTLRTISTLSLHVPCWNWKGTLRPLTQSGRKREGGFPGVCEATELIDQIAMLKAFAEGLDARIDSVRDANGVRALEREIYGKVGLVRRACHS